jgi:F0F1-type ATP synthase membrane subunit b/b'
MDQETLGTLLLIIAGIFYVFLYDFAMKELEKMDKEKSGHAKKP